jgi:hypothetical protein
MPLEQQEIKTQIHKNEDKHNQVTRTSQVPSPQQTQTNVRNLKSLILKKINASKN